jgi:hypothetical protein
MAYSPRQRGSVYLLYWYKRTNTDRLLRLEVFFLGGGGGQALNGLGGRASPETLQTPGGGGAGSRSGGGGGGGKGGQQWWETSGLGKRLAAVNVDVVRQVLSSSTCFTSTNVQVKVLTPEECGRLFFFCACLAPLKSAAQPRRRTQFTCFTSTNVQVLTPRSVDVFFFFWYPDSCVPCST